MTFPSSSSDPGHYKYTHLRTADMLT